MLPSDWFDADFLLPSDWSDARLFKSGLQGDGCAALSVADLVRSTEFCVSGSNTSVFVSFLSRERWPMDMLWSPRSQNTGRRVFDTSNYFHNYDSYNVLYIKTQITDQIVAVVNRAGKVLWPWGDVTHHWLTTDSTSLSSKICRRKSCIIYESESGLKEMVEGMTMCGMSVSHTTG